MAICEYVSPEERKEIMERLNEAMYREAPEEELYKIGGRLPILPSLALTLKQSFGIDALLETNLNLYDAVQEYGEDFLIK